MVGSAAFAAVNEDRAVQGEGTIPIEFQVASLQEKPKLASQLEEKHPGQREIGGLDDGLL